MSFNSARSGVPKVPKSCLSIAAKLSFLVQLWHTCHKRERRPQKLSQMRKCPLKKCTKLYPLSHFLQFNSRLEQLLKLLINRSDFNNSIQWKHRLRKKCAPQQSALFFDRKILSDLPKISNLINLNLKNNFW